MIRHSFFFFALLLVMTGCTTSAMVKRTKGYTDAQVQPLKGDTVFLHGAQSYVVQQKRSGTEDTEKMPAATLQPFPPPYYAYRPCPGCYGFLLITVPFDAATLPFQAIGLGAKYWFVHNYHE